MPQPKPTDAELELLNILWNKGPLTVRELHNNLTKTKDVRYTTVLKQLQVMYDKNLVKRDETSRSHIYSAAVDQQVTQERLLEHLLASAFGGSRSTLFMRALSQNKATPEELNEIKNILEEAEA